MTFSKYPAYMKSQVEWLGEVPTHWKVLKIKRIARLQSGDFITADSIETDSKYPVYGGNGLRGYTDNYTHKGEYALIGRQGALCGNINYASGEFWASEHAVVVHHTKEIVTHWLGELLRSMNLGQYSVSAAQPGLSVDRIAELYIPLTSKSEQTQIVRFLDYETARIDTLIAEQQNLIELLKEKRQALISHAVTKGLDPAVPMKDSGVEWLGEVPAHWVVKSIRRCLFEHRQGYYTTAPYVDDGVKLLRITDLRDLGTIEIEDCPKVEDVAGLGEYLLKEGDVVFARTGGAGSFGIIPKLKDKLAYASYLIRFRFDTRQLNTALLKYIFVADTFQFSVKENIHGGVNKNIHAEDIKAVNICFPLFIEQAQIAHFLDYETARIDSLVLEATLVVGLLRERRSTLISAAVTGKIDVRNWQPPAESNKTNSQPETMHG